MKKRYWLLLLFLVACAPIPEQAPKPLPTEMPVIQKPAPVEHNFTLYGKIDDFMISKSIPPFSFVSTDAIRDNFAIIPVDRYDARYKSSITVLVHVFKFSTREELDVVLNSEFYKIINLGASYYNGHNIALFLTRDDHRVAVWSSGTALVYVETFIPDFAAQEIVGAYLAKYPSDLETNNCNDSDDGNHFLKGTTSKVRIGSDIMQWTDTCLRDFALYRSKRYVSRKGLTEEDGLLEGQCEQDSHKPGFIFEYACPRGCVDGACSLA